MSTTTEAPGQQREAETNNWNAIEEAFTNTYEGTTLTNQKPATEVKTETIPPTEEKPDGAKHPPSVEEPVKTPEQEVETLKIEAKDLGLAETATKEEIEAAKLAKAADAPLFEFKAEDIKGNEGEPPEGSWLAVAKAKGIEIAEDSVDAFTEALIAPYVKQAQDAQILAKENLYTTMKPETATAFKLMEMGVPEEQLFHPTRQIEEYLKLEDAALVRADKEAWGWKPEMIDAELELLTTKNLLGHEAEKLRLTLNSNKADILKQREKFVQQYEGKRQEAILHQKEEERTQFTKAMNTVSTFMGAPIPADVKDALIKNYNKGLYDNVLNTPTSKVEYLLQRELSHKVLSVLKNTASQEGRDTIRKKLAEIPPAGSGNAGSIQQPNQIKDNWSAAEEAFK